MLTSARWKISHPDQIELRRSLHESSSSHASKDVQLSMAAVRSLDLPFATRLIVFHLQNVSLPSQGVSGSRQNAWQYVYPVNVVWMERIVSWRPLAQTSRASSSRWVKNAT